VNSNEVVDNFEPWAPAPGGQGWHVPTLEIFWVGIAHPEFPSLEIFLVRTAHPEFWAKTLRYCIMIIKQLSFYINLMIWVGNDALLPTQNTKSRVGIHKSREGNV